MCVHARACVCVHPKVTVKDGEGSHIAVSLRYISKTSFFEFPLCSPALIFHSALRRGAIPPDVLVELLVMKQYVELLGRKGVERWTAEMLSRQSACSWQE